MNEIILYALKLINNKIKMKNLLFIRIFLLYIIFSTDKNKIYDILNFDVQIIQFS